MRSHTSLGHDRRGAALAVVLVALVVVSALAAGAALASREVRRMAYDELSRARADARAGGSLEATVRRWNRRWSTLPIGGSDSTRGAADTADVVRVLRLDRTRFVVEAESRARAATAGAAGFAERTQSSVVLLDPPSVSALGAVTAGGSLALMNGAAVDGRDAPPAGWTGCPGPATDTAAVTTPSTTDVTLAPQAVVSGALKQHSAASDTATYALFGHDTWASLAARADVVVDGTAGPYVPAPNAVQYPLVLVHGNVTLQGPASVQGTLLVDGELTVNGNVTVAGVVIVRGALHAQSGALQLHGALLVAAGGSTLGPGSLVHFSRCATERALDAIAPARPARRRSWAEVTR